MKLILSRLLQGGAVVFIVTALTFWLLSAAGGDALTGLRNNPYVSEATLNDLYRIYGLDQPLAKRYTRWLAEAACGQLGHSYTLHAPVAKIIGPRLKRSAKLAFAALLLAWSGALAMAIAAARAAGKWVDRLCDGVVLLASSTPHLLLALVALILAARVSLFVVGASIPTFLLAAVVLCIPLLALYLAQTRASLASTLEQEFVCAARAKGLPERLLWFRHVLRPSLGPLLSVFGTSLGTVMSGSVIVEHAFDLPGLGQLSVDAVTGRDIPLLMGVVLVIATTVVAGNLLADLLLRWNDPRVK